MYNVTLMKIFNVA